MKHSPNSFMWKTGTHGKGQLNIMRPTQAIQDYDQILLVLQHANFVAPPAPNKRKEKGKKIL